MMKDETYIQLSRQLSALAIGCEKYVEMGHEILRLIGTYTQSNVLWVNKEGKVQYQVIILDTPVALPMQADGLFLEPRLFLRLMKIGKGAVRLPLISSTETQAYCQILLFPITYEDTLLLYRDKIAFEGKERVLGEICLPTLILLSRMKEDQAREERGRQAQLVKSVMNTLSFTELEVAVRIFDILGGTEGVLIAGKAADGLNVTRSVVVNALRKLESAQIIESRSLGVKGTYIRVLNSLWIEELKKIKV